MIKIKGLEFGKDQFNNKETIFHKPPIELESLEETIEVLMQFESDADITRLAIAKTWLDEEYPNVKKILIMPYIPYSRMDRDGVSDQLFTLKYFASIINGMNFFRVAAYDPHSSKCKELIKNLIDLTLTEIGPIVSKIESIYGINVIYYPDKGAMQKYPSIITTDSDIMHGIKERDLDNRGKLKNNLQVETFGKSLKHKRVLIVDDICCYGGTFVMAAKKLREMGVDEVYLFVTHCENAIFEGDLLDGGLVDYVLTTNSIIRHKKHENLQTISVWMGNEQGGIIDEL